MPNPGPQAEHVQTRTDLGRELTALRTVSGLTVRELAKRVGVPLATLGDYFSGRHLPGPAQVDIFRRVLGECGVTAPSDVGRWLDALNRARSASDGRAARLPPPYRGLEPFRTGDADIFFGREAVISEVVERLRTLADNPGPSGAKLILIGPSGSGKTSLLRAGVVPPVRSGCLDGSGTGWGCGVMTPGETPVQALRDRLASITGQRRLLVVDQLEELFSSTVDSKARAEFLGEVAGLGPATLVLFGLRADFYEAAAREPVLLEVLRHAHVVLGPMTQQELRRAVLEPARQMGAGVEEGLVDLLLADLAPSFPTGYAHEAGALPLMSHALLTTWQRGQGNYLSISSYLAAGGFRGAVRQSAEELYNGLSPAEQDLARRIFLRLVKVEVDVPPTRRRVSRHELSGLGTGEGEDAEAVLSRFVDARLVTVYSGTVEVSHEVLLSVWPRLAGWIEADRASLPLRNQFTEAANSWAASDRDESLLLRGNRLQVVADWASERGRDELNRTEQEFLDAGLANAHAEARAARRRARRLHQLLGVVATLALATTVLSVLALSAQASADRTRDQALSRQVAIESQELQPSDPALSMQLALAAYRISATVQARSRLVDTSAGEMPARLLGELGPTFLSLGNDGRLLAVAHAAAGSVSLYSLAGEHPSLLATVPVGPSSDQAFAVALSPNGHFLAAGGTDETVELFDVSKPAHPVRLATLKGFSSTVYSIAFSPGGTLVGAADNDGTVRQWGLSDPARPVVGPVLTAPKRVSLQALSYSPDGRLLAAAGANGTLLVWHTKGGPAVTAPGAGTAQLTSVAFNPASDLLVSGSQDTTVRVWPLNGAGRPQKARDLTGFTEWVNSVAFSPDGLTLAAGGSDSTARLWSTSNWAPESTFTTTDPLTSVEFTPDSQTLVTADTGGTTELWPLPPPTAYEVPGTVFALSYARGGKLLAAVGSGPKGDTSLWGTANPARPVHLAEVTMPPAFGPVAGAGALTPNGRLLAVANAKAQVELVGLSDPAHPVLLGKPLKGPSPLVEMMAFSPDGRLLAAGDDDTRVYIWDVARPARPEALSALAGPTSEVLGVAFSPNGRLLAAASADDHVYLWDISNPAHPKHLATLGGFSNYAYSVAFTPNGQTLAAGSADHTVRLWDVADPRHPELLGGPLTGPTSYVYDIAISPDGRTLAAAAQSDGVWLWDIASPAHPQLMETLTAASGTLFAVTFSPDDKTLVASGSDQVLHFWSFQAPDVATQVCSAAGDPITAAEWAQYVQGTRYDPPCRRP
jgi:WD40 repeat protein/transcriptional regulator with XRE-family HTH domain/energy-coupling factor transporter ATP-binding protein EcfA2